MVMVILAVELIGCVSMMKHTKTQNNAQKHDKNDREPPTQRTDRPLLATNQSETLAEPILCSQARNSLARREREVIFDTDSAWVGINNQCSGCISHVATDFVGELIESDVAIKGFAGSITRKVMKGMLQWKWTDDDGRTHKFLIPDSFYVLHGGARLLSPQHWAQTQKDRKPTFGTGEWTDAEKCILYWDQKRYKKTIYLDTGQSNVTTMRLAPRYHAFKAFCAEAEVDYIFGYDFKAFCAEAEVDYIFGYDFNPLIARAADISDDDESVIDPHNDLDSQEGWSSDKSQSTDHDVWHTEKPRTFNLVGKTSSPPNPVVIVDEEDKTGNQAPTTELLLYHYQFGHISFTKLQLMAKFGILLEKIRFCSWYMSPTHTSEEFSQDPREFGASRVGSLLSNNQCLLTSSGPILE